jgi:ABC-type bacteriocin/lantibiotic exporter with double-glycine peptidase domain
LAGDSVLPLQRSNELTQDYLKARNTHFQILVKQYRVLIVFKLILSAFFIILGSVLVVENLINIGQFVAAEIIILLLINSIEKIILNMSTVYDVLTSLEKLGDTIEMPLEREGGQSIPQPQSLRLDVNHLRFQFSDANVPLITDLALHVAPGERICIQGKEGSGKSTLLRLISGYYENFDGQIAFNHISVKALKLQELRALLGENFSENEIFAGTIWDNISCGRPSISEEDVMSALKKVDLLSWFQSQNKGLSTLLAPSGIGLPGHIRRRLMLARNFAGSPSMILVEDSPYLQAPAERKLFYDLLFAHCQDITTLVFSNDAKIAERCHRTYVLENGSLTLVSTQS